MNSSLTPGSDVHAARLLLEYYGYDSLSYFTLHDKKRFFFSSTGRSFLSYTISQGVALVSGDPIGPRADVPTLLQEFTYFAKGAELTMCFIGIHESSIPLVTALHHKVLYAGDEAIVDLRSYDKQLLHKKVRRAENHNLKVGIQAVFYSRKNLPTVYLRQIEKISHEWVKEKGGKERGFSMTLGRLPGEYDTDCELALALNNNRVVGYLTFVPAYAARMLSLDECRREKDTPNGLTEFLFLQAFDYYQAHGVQKLSLNFATFHRHDTDNMSRPQNHLSILFYKTMSSLYKTDQLYAFNEKFQPTWQSRYVSFEKKRRIPSYLLAIAKTELNI